MSNQQSAISNQPEESALAWRLITCCETLIADLLSADC